MLPTILPTICFIACHGGPADHLATYYEGLDRTQYHVSFLATGAAFKKLQQLKIEVIELNPENLDLKNPSNCKALAHQIAQNCAKLQIVITDVAHPFAAFLHKAFKELKITEESGPVHLCYYDNPEDFVPGGFSTNAALTMKLAVGVLFANKKHATQPVYEEDPSVNGGKVIDLKDKLCFGIGYNPLAKIQEIRQKRMLNHLKVRREYLASLNLTDKGQAIRVYFGGNNSNYFEKSLPKFFEIIQEASLKEDLSHTIIVMHQHPDAKQRNEEKRLIEAYHFAENPQTPTFIISNLSSEEAQILADSYLYDQTSMSPLLVALAPTVQIGIPYRDLVVREELCQSIKNADGFIKMNEKFLDYSPENMPKIDEKLKKGLGVSKNPIGKLQKSLDSFIKK